MTRRILLVAALLVATSAYLAQKSTAEPTARRQALRSLPMELGSWHGRQEPDFEEKILAVLGVDDYARRTYFARAQGWIGLYIGYYASQRQGDTVHSPLNCLPGAGWTPIEQNRTDIVVRDSPGAAETRPITVNRFVIQKGLDRQVVLYWYQSHDRVIASEYWGRVYTVVDAIRHNRTDAALVRVVVPVYGETPEAIHDAERRGTGFVEALFPYLSRHLPS
jgi:EpsI family protein